MSTTIATTTLNGNPSAPDVIVTAKVEVAALFGSDEPLFDLGDAEIKLTWADVNLPEQVTLDRQASARAQEALGFLQRSVDGVLGRTLLGGRAAPAGGRDRAVRDEASRCSTRRSARSWRIWPIRSRFRTSAVSSVSTVFADGANRKFVVDVSGSGPGRPGSGRRRRGLLSAAAAARCREPSLPSIRSNSPSRSRRAGSGARRGESRLPHRRARHDPEPDHVLSRRSASASQHPRNDADAAGPARGSGRPARRRRRRAGAPRHWNRVWIGPFSSRFRSTPIRSRSPSTSTWARRCRAWRSTRIRRREVHGGSAVPDPDRHPARSRRADRAALLHRRGRRHPEITLVVSARDRRSRASPARSPTSSRSGSRRTRDGRAQPGRLPHRHDHVNLVDPTERRGRGRADHARRVQPGRADRHVPCRHRRRAGHRRPDARRRRRGREPGCPEDLDRRRDGRPHRQRSTT